MHEENHVQFLPFLTLSSLLKRLLVIMHAYQDWLELWSLPLLIGLTSAVALVLVSAIMLAMEKKSCRLDFILLLVNFLWIVLMCPDVTGY